MAAQDPLGLAKFRRLREILGILEIEHDRRVQEKSRAALDLSGEFELKSGIAQHPRAHHHDGEDRALHETTRHVKRLPKFAWRFRRPADLDARDRARRS